MKGLDPLMDGILERMNEVTDNSNLRKIQADRRVETTKAALLNAHARLDYVHNGGLIAPGTDPLYRTSLLPTPPALYGAVMPPLSKEDMIHQVVRNTLNKIEG